MRIFIFCLLITTMTLGLFVNEASAGRFGGGRSFGVQRSQSSLFSSRAPQSKMFGQKANNTHRWGGMLGGLLIGGLLASLFMGHGLGAGLLSWLAVGAVAFFLIGFFRKRMQPNFQPANSSSFRENHFDQPTENSGNNSTSYPAGFDPETFLREAKVTFIRLQTAYDQKNRQDLSVFTAPEVFGEIEMQLQERGDEPNKTNVIELNAELLDVSKQADSTIASVRFTGSIQENNDPVMPLDEIWHFRQFFGNKNWVVGGIQQSVVEPR